jgi:hypothetical protein
MMLKHFAIIVLCLQLSYSAQLSLLTQSAQLRYDRL